MARKQNKTLPQGVSLTPHGYRARTSRGGRWHCAGTHATADAAVDALRTLEASLPARAPAGPRARHASWAQALARQRAALPEADMTAIYPTAHGWAVKFSRHGQIHYGGHYPELSTAITRRDALLKNPPSSPDALR